MAEQNSTLNSAQLQQARAQMSERVVQIISEMQLRKWSMEQAIAIVFSPNPINPPDATLVAIAAEIYDFVSKPALEFKADK